MKFILTILSALFLMLASVSVAHAVVCAKGVYRAGCAGSNGAVVVRKPPVVVAPRAVVVAPPRNCVWVNGRRVCR